MPNQPPPEGATLEREYETKPGMGVTHVGPTEMLSTPEMIRFMERTSMELLKQYIDMPSVGFRVDVRHFAPTPVPGKVRVRTTYLRQEGRRYVFHVEAHAGDLKIGEGTHERAVVDPARYQQGK